MTANTLKWKLSATTKMPPPAPTQLPHRSIIHLNTFISPKERVSKIRCAWLLRKRTNIKLLRINVKNILAQPAPEKRKGCANIVIS